MTGIERHYAEQAELEREVKRKQLAELRAGVTPILQEIEKLSWELEPALHIPWTSFDSELKNSWAWRRHDGTYFDGRWPIS